MSVDDLVAGLNPVRDEWIEAGPGGRDMLAAVMAGPQETPPRRRLRGWWPVAGLAAATAVATAAVVAVGVTGPGETRSYANAAVAIERKGETYEVSVKNVYAEQHKFTEAFAKFGLKVELRIVPVTPDSERKLISLGGQVAREGGKGPTISVDDCPSGRRECPIKVRLSDAVPGDSAEIKLGRKARPGEPYADTAFRLPTPEIKTMAVVGRSVDDAVTRLRTRGLGARFAIGTMNPDGSGGMYDPPTSWRPTDGRRVVGAWLYSSDAVTLLVNGRKGDPRPTPAS